MSELRAIPFSMVPIEAARDHRLSASDYRVLIAILSFRKKNTDTAAVSREWLGQRAAYHPNSISRITKRLQALGWIEKTGDGGRCQWSEYRVTVPDIPETLTEPVTVSENPNQPGQETLTNPDRKPSPDWLGAIPTEKDRKEQKKRPRSRGPISVDSFLSDCKAAKEKPIPPDDPVFQYADEAGIPHEFLHLCWLEFVERNRARKKRYKSWRQAFRNCVREGWYGLWWIDSDGNYALTTKGRQAQKKHREAA